MTVNTCAFTGNVCREPELKSTPTGIPVLTFGLAVNERRKGQDGSWTDYGNFLNCVMYGSRAESVSRYLSKGMKVAIQASAHQDRWQDRDGRNKEKIVFKIDEIEFFSRLTSANSDENAALHSQTTRQPLDEHFSDDIPF